MGVEKTITVEGSGAEVKVRSLSDRWIHAFILVCAIVPINIPPNVDNLPPQTGHNVTVHCTGQVVNADGSLKKFWSTRDPGQTTFKF